MLAFLISIRPEWVAKIFNGKKKAEIRRTFPKEWKDYLSGKTKTKPEPMTGYIYCTKGKPYVIRNPRNGINEGLSPNEVFYDSKKHTKYGEALNGKVVAKFTLNEVEEVHYDAWGECFYIERNDFRTQVASRTQTSSIACLTFKELEDYYFKNEFKFGLYAYHISDLVIFDKPMELSDFMKPDWDKGLDKALERASKEDLKMVERICSGASLEDEVANSEELTLAGFKLSGRIKRPPQSWCYVEEPR